MSNYSYCNLLATIVLVIEGAMIHHNNVFTLPYGALLLVGVGIVCSSIDKNK